MIKTILFFLMSLFLSVSAFAVDNEEVDETPFHVEHFLALNGPQLLKAVLESILAKQQSFAKIQEILLAQDNTGRTILHHLASTQQCTVISEILNLLHSKNVSPDTIKKLLLAQDNDGQTMLHILLPEQAKMVGEILELLLKNWKITVETISKLLLVRDNQGQTILHTAAFYGQWTVIERILNLLLNYKNHLLTLGDCTSKPLKVYVDTIKNLLLAQDNDGQTIFHLLAANKNNQVLEELLRWLRNALNKFRNDKQKAAFHDAIRHLLLLRNSNNQTFLDMLNNYQRGILQELLAELGIEIEDRPNVQIEEVDIEGQINNLRNATEPSLERLPQGNRGGASTRASLTIHRPC